MNKVDTLLHKVNARQPEPDMTWEKSPDADAISEIVKRMFPDSYNDRDWFIDSEDWEQAERSIANETG